MVADLKPLVNLRKLNISNQHSHLVNESLRRLENKDMTFLLSLRKLVSLEANMPEIPEGMG